MPRSTDEVLADLQRGLASLEAAVPGYEQADEYYSDTDTEVFVSDALRVYLGGQVNVFGLNLASIPVDTVADRLFIAAVTSPDSRVQKELDLILAENDFWTWSNIAMRNAQKYGDNFIGVWVGENQRPQIVAMSPLTTRIIYDSELERFPLYAVRCWDEMIPDTRNVNARPAKLSRANIAYGDEVYKFSMQEGAQAWEAYQPDGEDWPIKVETNLLMYGHLRNGMPYGTPGHVKSYGMQRILTKAVLNMAANLDFMGIRQRYALKNPDQLQVSQFEEPMVLTANGVQRVRTSNVRPSLTAGPGKLWEMVANAVGEFSPTDVGQFLDLLERVASLMAAAERLPVRLFIDRSGQQSSGDSQREAEKSLKQRTAAARVNLAAGWVYVFQSALALLGIKNAEVQIEWQRDEVITDKTAYEAAGLAVALILSAVDNPALEPIVAQKLEELGYSSDEILTFLGGVTQDKPNPDLPGDPSQEQ